jgi:hypothetical protein
MLNLTWDDNLFAVFECANEFAHGHVSKTAKRKAGLFFGPAFKKGLIILV